MDGSPYTQQVAPIPVVSPNGAVQRTETKPADVVLDRPIWIPDIAGSRFDITPFPVLLSE
eukprot:127305-Karenia_brevis.AAC.2